MATGINNLPYPGKVYSPFDILTAEELNEDVANIESLADGSGIGDGAIPELKTVIKNSYSTSEVDTGAKWIDGKAIYKKTVSFGTMPNNTTKSVAHGISGISAVIDLSAWWSNGSNFFFENHTDPAGIGFAARFSATATEVSVVTGSDRSSYTTCYITLWYTKT